MQYGDQVRGGVRLVVTSGQNGGAGGVRHQEQYELTFHAETLGIGAAKLPNMPDDITDPRARLEERATQIRHLIETLDLLYDAFGQQRLSKDWSDTLPKMQKWLTREERRAA